MNDEQIEHMVNRFLGWKLPKDFSPDAGISFKAEYNEGFNAARGKPPSLHQPSGTNLFDAQQAEAMVRYMVEGMTPSQTEGIMTDSPELAEIRKRYVSMFARIEPSGAVQSYNDCRTLLRMLDEAYKKLVACSEEFNYRLELSQKFERERDAFAAELAAHKRLNADLETSDIRLRARVAALEAVLREVKDRLGGEFVDIEEFIDGELTGSSASETATEPSCPPCRLEFQKGYSQCNDCGYARQKIKENL